MSAQNVQLRNKAFDQHFHSDHLKENLRRRSIDAGYITALAQCCRLCLNLLSVTVMARLLVPTEFGLVAMVTPITSFIGLFKDLGLSIATIQKAEITHDQVSVLFWLNVFISIILFFICVGISPLVGMFYGDQRTTWITLVLAATFLLGGLTAQHQALLKRQMRFSTLAVIDIMTMASSVASGIIAACLGWGYWSIVAMTVGGGMVNCMAIWIASPWRPGWPKRHVGARELVSYGGFLTGFQICGFVSGNFDKMVIGKFMGASALGIYNRAYQVLVMPIDQVFGPIYNVMLPALSRLSTQPERYRHAVIQVAELILLIATPFMAISIIAADQIIWIFLGPKWMEAVTIYRALCLVAIAIPINNLGVIVLQSTGKTNVLLRWGPISMTISLISILLGLRWGVNGIAYSWALGALFLRTPWFYLLISRNTPIKYFDLVRPIGFYLISFALIVMIGYVVHPPFSIRNDILGLAMYVSVGIAIHSVFVFATGKHKLLLALLSNRGL